MERLTERDEFGNANIIGVDSMDLQCNLGFDEFKRVTNALNKLAEYEDLEREGKMFTNRKLNRGAEIWVVEWTRRYGAFSGNTEQCYQAFTDKEEAYDFAESIRRANKLIGNTSQTSVTVTKQSSGLGRKEFIGVIKELFGM